MTPNPTLTVGVVVARLPVLLLGAPKQAAPLFERLLQDFTRDAGIGFAFAQLHDLAFEEIQRRRLAGFVIRHGPGWAAMTCRKGLQSRRCR